MERLTSSLEDYLEIIFNYTNISKDIRAIDISRELKVSRASVTEALKKLADKGYLNYGRYGSISLTENGKIAAKSVASKHVVLQNFFEKVIGLSKEEASVNACRIEHVITETAFEKISEYINK